MSSSWPTTVTTSATTGTTFITASSSTRRACAYLETDISRFKENERRHVRGFVGNGRAVRSSDYKLVYTPRQGKGVWEMYDPLRDSAELNNLIELGTAPTKELEAMMKELVRWIPADERAQLERLGNRFDVVPNAASSVATPKRGGAAKQHGASVHTDLLRSLGYVQ